MNSFESAARQALAECTAKNRCLMALFLQFDYSGAVQSWLQYALETASDAEPLYLYVEETRLQVGDTVRIFPYGVLACAEEEGWDPDCWEPSVVPACELPRGEFVDICNAFEEAADLK